MRCQINRGVVYLLRINHYTNGGLRFQWVSCCSSEISRSINCLFFDDAVSGALATLRRFSHVTVYNT